MISIYMWDNIIILAYQNKIIILDFSYVYYLIKTALYIAKRFLNSIKSLGPFLKTYLLLLTVYVRYLNYFEIRLHFVAFAIQSREHSYFLINFVNSI